MRILGVAGLFSLLLGTSATTLSRRDHDTNDYFALHLDASASPDRIAQRLGARHEGQIGELADHHSFSFPRGRPQELDELLEDLQRRRRRRKRGLELDKRDGDELDGVLWSQKLSLRKHLHKRIPPPPVSTKADRPSLARAAQSGQLEDAEAVKKKHAIATELELFDPTFAQQWHLFNTMTPGRDLNVTGLWLEGITGNGSTSAIVDDGIDMYSHDLKDNYFADGSYDFNEKSKEPKPQLVDDKHGTRCAGEVAAVKNDICGVGVAYDSKVAGIRILSKPVSDADEAEAINYEFQKNHIYSCSWGPIDNGATMDAPGLLIKRAMVNGVQKGRDGKGSIYVFAAGNGAASEDNCNFDGYTNSIYSITVGAIDDNDEHPAYSESCSAQLVVTYSSGGQNGIYTTDVGLDSCSPRHGGTSAAGPLVVGIVALVLGVRPDLSWRDVQHLIVQTAVPVHLDKDGWQKTAIGKHFSHEYGYGKADAYAVVDLAKEWKPVKPQAWLHSPWMLVHTDIPQGDQGLMSSYVVTEDMMKKENLERVEHVTVTMNVNHTRRGDLSAELHSPSGIVSYISTARSEDLEEAGYIDWTFMSVAHWGESGKGNWTVIVKDTAVNEYKGRFLDWQLTLWGESINAKKQKLHPLPEEDDHDHATTSASLIATTTIKPSTSETSAPTKPTSQVDRPVNQKPTVQGAPASSTSTPSPSASSNSTALPITDNFLPSPFPTFGVSKSTQIWIYGSIALIVIFCVALGIYFLVQRRKRIRNNPRDDYEFEMVAEDEEGHALSGAADGRGGGKGEKQRRGGELYEAFAGESDEEIFSDEEDHDEPYRDDGPATEGRWSEKRRGSSDS